MRWLDNGHAREGTGREVLTYGRCDRMITERDSTVFPSRSGGGLKEKRQPWIKTKVDIALFSRRHLLISGINCSYISPS